MALQIHGNACCVVNIWRPAIWHDDVVNKGIRFYLSLSIMVWVMYLIFHSITRNFISLSKSDSLSLCRISSKRIIIYANEDYDILTILIPTLPMIFRGMNTHQSDVVVVSFVSPGLPATPHSKQIHILRQAIIWTSAGLLSIVPWGTNLSEILIKIQNFSFAKMHLEISSAKKRELTMNRRSLPMPWPVV